MKKMTIEMPVVARCGIRGCAYNEMDVCHAKAITIGDLVNPECDAYLKASPHRPYRESSAEKNASKENRSDSAGVGACKVASCRHNVGLQCSANEIEVGLVNKKDIYCLTFEAQGLVAI